MSSVRDVGRRAALVAADQLGHRTASRRVLPTMLIIGAQRCGTTTLFKTLSQHPNFAGPTLRKGVHYFDLHHEEPLDWYRAHFPTKSAVDAVQQRTGAGVTVGESSPYYLWHPLAADRIASALPGVRVVALLRDPVERAYSAHAHELARGFETEPFERALELEPERLADQEAPASKRRSRQKPSPPAPCLHSTRRVHRPARARGYGHRPRSPARARQRRLLGATGTELADRHVVPGLVRSPSSARTSQRPLPVTDEPRVASKARRALRAVR